MKLPVRGRDSSTGGIPTDPDSLAPDRPSATENDRPSPTRAKCAEWLGFFFGNPGSLEKRIPESLE